MIKVNHSIAVALCIVFSFTISSCKKKEPGEETIDVSDGIKKATQNSNVDEELMMEQLSLKIVGPNGKPVEGAKVGTGYEVWLRSYGKTELWGLGRKRLRPSGTPASLSDSQGIVRLFSAEVFSRADYATCAPIYIWEDREHLAAIILVTPDEVGQLKTVMLEPTCRVHGVVQSKELSQIGQPLHDVHTYLSLQRINIFMSYISEGAYEFFLPSGEYKLQYRGASIVGGTTESQSRTIAVTPNKKEIDLGVTDLPATRVSLLVGKIAPELRNIKEWRNHSPVRLSDLKGKIVILDFWGFWCIPCLYAMPELIEIHDRFVNKGVVIIAIHDDSVVSIEEMNQKLQNTKAEIWEGRDLPFIVALDGGGMTMIEGSNLKVNGSTHAAYKIQAWPTMLVIGRDGKIVRIINHAHSAPLELVIQRMLGQVPQRWKPWLTSECEACDIERYYNNQTFDKQP